jgi:energy-converting hydrogenase Eha subunit G
MGEWAGVSTLVWQAGFMVFFIAPALAVSALLVARGTHLTNSGEQPRQSQ